MILTMIKTRLALLLVIVIVVLAISLLLINDEDIDDEEENEKSLDLYTRSSTTSNKIMSAECKTLVNEYNISMNKFVLALNYWEQLTMATRSLCRLTQFSKEWGARTVMPYTHKSELWGLPSKLRFHGLKPTYDRQGILKPLDSLYNMTLFNSQLLCKNNQVPPLATFNDFITHGSRSIIIIHTSYNGHTPYFKSVTNKHYVNCLQTMAFRKLSRIILKFLNKKAIERKLSQYTVTSACCVNHRHITTPQEMAKQCGFSDQDSLSVILTDWRGYSDYSPNIKNNFRLKVPKDFQAFVFNYPFPLNNDLLSNVSAYYRDISKGRDFIAIHFRTAKLGMLDYFSKGNISSENCFEEVWKLIRQLKQNYRQFPIKYFVDFGPYGSNSHEIEYGKHVSKKPFKENNVTQFYYDPLKYGGILDSGYVSLVEQNTIAKAKILVLVGGGSFQYHTLNRFSSLRNTEQASSSNKNNVYTICWTKKSLSSYSVNISPLN